MTADMTLSDHTLNNRLGYSFSISARSSSFDFPSRCCRRPRNSSSFPSANERSSSVNWPYFCFNFPFTSFQLPLTCNFVVITKGLRCSPGAWLSVNLLHSGFLDASSSDTPLLIRTLNRRAPYPVFVIPSVVEESLTIFLWSKIRDASVALDMTRDGTPTDLVSSASLSRTRAKRVHRAMPGVAAPPVSNQKE